MATAEQDQRNKILDYYHRFFDGYEDKREKPTLRIDQKPKPSIFFGGCGITGVGAATAELRQTLRDILNHRGDYDYLNANYGSQNLKRGRVRVRENLLRLEAPIEVSIDGDHWVELNEDTLEPTLHQVNLIDYMHDICTSEDLRNAQLANSMKWLSVRNKVAIPIGDNNSSVTQHVVTTKIEPNILKKKSRHA